LAVIALVRARLPRKAAAAQFALWGFCIMVFIPLLWSVHKPLFAGMWVSIASCGLLIIGAAVDWFQCRRVSAQERP